ncbi:transcription repressor OFP13-like [Sesamum indicum]|uniref:Transcription repressor n=1 Tax=Sesamum indicum TaxID=4182 RepID=A0A6I9U243_SESIN|nr:transcription repressor OFP13-like [Sesamum indicum]
MGKKMKFPFLFKPTETTTFAAPAWPWPACVNNPKTLSFRAGPAATTNANNIYKTMNSAYLHDKSTAEFAETPDSFFSICDSFSHRHEESFSCASETCSETAVIRGLRSDRLFFEPGETSSILEEVKSDDDFPYKGSAAIMAMDSRDPFTDFRVSMEEMVEAHGLKEWECLEELLSCYLRVNGKSNHGYIVGAFVDLLLRLAIGSSNDTSSTSAIDEQYCSSSSTTTQYSFTSPLSFSSSTYSSTSPCFSLLENEDEIAVEKNHVDSSSSGV